LGVLSTSSNDVVALGVHRQFVNGADVPALWEASANESGHLNKVALAGDSKIESGVAEKASLPAVSGVETLKAAFCGSCEVFVEVGNLTEGLGGLGGVLNYSCAKANS
jgi:hypothetical protein